MASFEKYQDKTGHTMWRARYRKPDGKPTTKSKFPTKKAASDWASDTHVKIMTGDYVAPSLGRITVGELAPSWLALKKNLSASHYRTLDTAWRCHVKPAWGATPVADITLADIEDWVARMSAVKTARNGSRRTVVLRAHGVLSGILAYAVKKKRLAANAALGVENFPDAAGKRRVYLSADDVTRLADESGQHRVLVLVLAYCGVRWGEAIALRVSDIAFLRRRLNVHANAVQLGVDHATGRTKGRIDRSVPVPQFVLDELSVLCTGKEFDDLVFGDGTHYLPRPKSLDGWFAGAVKRAKVQKITPHDLRHTCASLAVSAGANILALQKMLGHKSAKMTLDTYGDLYDDDLDAVALRLHAKYSPDAPDAPEAKDA
jgi:integrase